MAKRLALCSLLGGVVVLTAGSAGATGSGSSAGAAANAYAVKISIPGQAGAQAGVVKAPPYHVSFGDSFTYPADGSIVTTGSLATSATSDQGTRAVANASGEAQIVSLFGDEITADDVLVKASGSTRGLIARGVLSNSSITNLVVLGQAVNATTNDRIPLADWGYLTTLEQGTDKSAGHRGAQAFDGFVTGLDVHLTATHDGLPAGSEIQVGYAEAAVQAPPKPHKQVAPATTRAKHTPKAPKSKKKGSGPLLPGPLTTQPRLGLNHYVFPVYGPVSFTDTYGAFRGDVSGDWHHGDDIFAPLGAPVLAVADGIVFSVGWQSIGGNRLWLRDAQGNEFYYAHLSAFSPLAKNGQRVRAGEVLGFVGNTGDAAGTPTHLHFEIHPASLIWMGYDGAVDPTAYLTAWQHLQDVRFENVAGWVPAAGITDPAPKPAAIVLQVSDISEASGLDPGSLQRAISPKVPGGGDDQGLIRALGYRGRPTVAGTARG